MHYAVLCQKCHKQDLEGKIEYWMSKHEEDVEVKSKELQDVKVVCPRELFSALLHRFRVPEPMILIG